MIKKPNKSTALLAKAMQDVFAETFGEPRAEGSDDKIDESARAVKQFDPPRKKTEDPTLK